MTAEGPGQKTRRAEIITGCGANSLPIPVVMGGSGPLAPIIGAAQICHFRCALGFASSSARGWLESGEEEHNAI